jgi:hypothetical protein
LQYTSDAPVSGRPREGQNPIGSVSTAIVAARRGIQCLAEFRVVLGIENSALLSGGEHATGFAENSALGTTSRLV